MKFNLNDYVMVEDRIRDFYDKYPNGRIETRLVQATDNLESVIVYAAVYKDETSTVPLATGLAQEQKAVGGFANEVSWVENAETSAIGRSLANAGFQKKGEPRPTKEEMTKKDRLEGGNSVPSSPPPSQPKKKPTTQEITTSPSNKIENQLKQVVLGMADNNKEFAKTAYDSALNMMDVKYKTKDIENFDMEQQKKFMDFAEKFIGKYETEGKKMKPFEEMSLEEKAASVFGTVEVKEGEDMADIPSGKWEQDPVSDAQKNFLNTLIVECIDSGNANAEKVANECKSLINNNEMTKKDASLWIDKLKNAKS